MNTIFPFKFEASLVSATLRNSARNSPSTLKKDKCHKCSSEFRFFKINESLKEMLTAFFAT